METWALGPNRVYYDEPDAKGRMPSLPSAVDLADLDVVIIPKERLRSEWANGRPSCALEERRPARWGDFHGFANDDRELSELFRIRWLRIIVDEGHSLGALSITNEGKKRVCLVHSDDLWSPIAHSTTYFFPFSSVLFQNQKVSCQQGLLQNAAGL